MRTDANQPELQEVLDATHALADLLEASGRGKYYYDIVGVKRWVLGPGGRSGNCEICIDNADQGWIDQDDVFDGVFGPVDDGEAHPNCTCSVEYGEKRKRVYF